jgi:hypothetical protein
MTVRQYGPAWIAAEFLAWILFPVGLLWMLYDRASRWAGSTPEQRVARMVRWYPPTWRERHGEEFAALLRDAIADGEDGPRLWLDVAREAAAVRVQEAVRARRMWAAAALWTLGVIAILPLTVVPLLLGREGLAELVVDDRAAAAAATIAAGLLLIVASARLVRGRAARS